MSFFKLIEDSGTQKAFSIGSEGVLNFEPLVWLLIQSFQSEFIKSSNLSSLFCLGCVVLCWVGLGWVGLEQWMMNN